jgi:PmbA protein
VAFGTTDPFAGVAQPDGVTVTDVELWSDELAHFAVEDKIALAKELEQYVLGADARVTVEDANYADGGAEAAVANTAGIRRYGRENGCYLVVSSLAEDDGEMQTGFGFSVGRQPDELSVAKAGGDAAERATRLLGAIKPASKRTTVVLSPYVTAQFLGIIGATLNGESVSKGRSLFRDRLGDAMANPLVTLVDDPTNPLAYTATDVDGEGLAARRNVLIDNGVLRQFVHNTYSARRMTSASTGNAVRGGFKGTPGVGCLALQLQPGTRSAEELIAGIDDGVLIYEVSGMHSGVNPISGDFSTGASGLSITNGQLGQPVREFTLGSTLQRMLLDVVDVGADVEWLPMSAAGVSLVIADVMLSGT